MSSKSPFLRAGLRSLVLTSVVTALMAAPAAAQTPSVDGYSGSGPAIERGLGPDARTGSGSGNDPSGDSQAAAGNAGRGQGSALPFTGLDLVLLGGAGVALLSLGLGLRVLIRPIHQAG